MIKINPDWYKEWFNSAYYHILYKKRDQVEAQNFMLELFNYLNLPEHARVLDLACGRGRHAEFIAKLGYDVLGVDLSPQSISYAQKKAHDKLSFKVHDMRIPLKQDFDVVLNLFTSFGYFESVAENFETLKAIQQNISKEGYGVLDFLNANYVSENLVKYSEQIEDYIQFKIKRWIEQGFVYKEIKFTDQDQNYTFYERVKLITEQEFDSYLKTLNLNVVAKFGDYKLNPFDVKHSKRLILIYQP